MTFFDYGYGPLSYGFGRTAISQVGWRLITAPTDRPMTDVAAFNHLRIEPDQTADVEFIRTLIDGATEYIENRGHILMPQTWEMVLDRFPYFNPILIFKNPVGAVDFIKFIDSNGNEQTWDPALYKVATSSIPARIQPAYGESWPITRCEPEAVRIRLQLGYDNSPATIPRTLMNAMKLLVGHLYENRETVVVDSRVAVQDLPLGLEALIESAIGRARAY